MIKVPKNTSSTFLQSSCDFLKKKVSLKRCYVERFGTKTFGFEKGLFATTSSHRFGNRSVFINLLQSRLSIVSQIYTSVLKTKVKLIEYAFEMLPAWALSMPPSKARKYNKTINNVSGKHKGVPQLTENTLSREKNALLLFFAFFHRAPLFSCLRKFITES